MSRTACLVLPLMLTLAPLVTGQSPRLSHDAWSHQNICPDPDSPPPSQRKAEPAGHWAFQPVTKVEPPKDPTGRFDHPIDRFIASKLHAESIEPLGLADKRTLIRRVTFDLIGLPPSPDEVAAFLADDSPDAFASVVDRLLGSPRYGERWGRHWMDVVRYADSAGDNADYPVPEIRLYRDYIIDSFNADKPFDQFVREQIAGDILASQGPREKYAERVIATGFLALSRRYATAPEELWHLTLEDTIETTGRAFLGLSLRCARCHDHKFDPVTMEDYYALYGLFASTKFPYAGSEEFESKKFPRSNFQSLLPSDEVEPQLKAHDAKIARLQAEIQRIEKEDPLAQRIAELNPQVERLTKQVQEQEPEQQDNQPLNTQLALLQKEREEANRQLQAKLNAPRNELHDVQGPGLPPDVPGAYAVREGNPSNVPIQIKGDPNQPGRVVRRNVPAFLSSSTPNVIPENSSGRLELAEWLTRPDHPLTARVLVNRIWQHHLGHGIVATPSSFGARGEEPTHPELLDWLANQFVASGWSVKAMHRLILSSQAYRRASGSAEFGLPNAELDSTPPHSALRGPHLADPANRWYGRFGRRRLDAEAIRDAMLAVSGKLDLERPGPHPFPPIDQWHWTQHNPFKAVFPSNHRSVYLMTQRLQRHPYLALFDGPDTNYSTDVRSNSTVPLQALYLMNNPFVSEQAAGLGERLIAASPDIRKRIELAHELAWSRTPRPIEYEKGIAYIERYSQELKRAEAPADQIQREAWTSYARVLLAANEFVYVD